MDDGAGAAVARQFAGGDEGGDRGRRDGVAVLVDDEAAVGVAVEGDAEVGAVCGDCGLTVGSVGGSMGLAPGRVSLMPLSVAGLWLAVMTAAWRRSAPEAK